MKLILFTDAWFPQINGVVNTLDKVRSALQSGGDTVDIISPSDFKTVPCPTYPEIRLALRCKAVIRKHLEAVEYDAIHIATEGPIGIAARRVCLQMGLSFTTAYHTKFPEYVAVRTGLPVSWMYGVMRWFHKASSGVMVATKTLHDELHSHGIEHLKRWSRGVDLGLFRPCEKGCLPALNRLERPIMTYVGRVAVEKNIKAFLEVEAPGTKVIVGSGPHLKELKKQFPEAVFFGAKTGDELAKHYAASDVFVFPSKTDTFGLVMLEALASGVPVAAYPVPGPLDVIGAEGLGVLHSHTRSIGSLKPDLAEAIAEAIACDPAACRAYANEFSWAKCADLFRSNLVLARSHSSGAAAKAQTVSAF